MRFLSHWPVWGTLLLRSVVTLAVAWGIGRLISAVVIARAASWAVVRQHVWVETAVRVTRRRLPWWALLVGLWLTAGYWPLPGQVRLLVDQILFALGGLSVTLAAAAIASQVMDRYGAVLAPALPVSSLTRNIAWGLVATLGLLVVLNGLGLSIAPMLTALGVGGLAVALALQEPLANFFAGVFLTLAGQIRVGDYVRLESGQEGYVIDFSWRTTRLRMLANNLILVPNAKLAQAIVVNHHLPSRDLAVLVEAGVDYASDLGHVERVVTAVGRDVMTTVAGGVAEFQPFVRFHTFGESSVDFSVILRGKEFTDQYLIKHEFIKRLHARFAAEGIAIPFPIRTIDFRSMPGAAADGSAAAGPVPPLPESGR